MPIYQITPLAPAVVLLLGALLIRAVGPSLLTRRRCDVAVVISALAVLSLFLIGSGYLSQAGSVRVLVEWLGQPALAVRVPRFDPLLWVLLLSLLAISLAARGKASQLAPRSQAMLFALTAAACGVVLSGTYRTLAFALLIFDGIAALFALSAEQPGRSVGRLLLGVVSSAMVIGVAQGMDDLSAYPFDLGALFGLTIWLRLGLYPLLESDTPPAVSPMANLGWNVVNLVVGLYLVSTGLAPWLAWLAGLTALLHGVLAWLEPASERALLHVGYTLAGGMLTLVALIGYGPAAVAASISTLAAVTVLSLTPSRLNYAIRDHPQRMLAYLPPFLATVSVLGVPFTLGWVGRGLLYGITWEAGLPGALAVVVLAEGAALSALYRLWRTLLPGLPSRENQRIFALEEGEAAAHDDGGQKPQPDRAEIWPWLGAALVCLPFLVPVLGPRLLRAASASLAPVPGLSVGGAWLGLLGSLLWAVFLGYGRLHLLNLIPWPTGTLARILRLHWLLQGLGHVLDTGARVLLRTRALIEGEHYLAWAILLALGLVLIIVLR